MRPYVITVGLFVCLELLSGWDLVIDGNDIQPHTIKTHDERTSMESNLVTAQSTAHKPPEDGRKYGPKHLGATWLKCFQVF